MQKMFRFGEIYNDSEPMTIEFSPTVNNPFVREQ